jgi:hypothetical protein
MKDMAFRNSVRFMANLLMWPVLMIIYAIIAFVVLPWQWALVAIVALVPAPVVAHETWRLIRLVASDVKLLFSSELRAKYREIRKYFI